MRRTRWVLTAQDAARAYTLAARLRISPTTAQMLLNRGVTTPEEAGEFLAPSLDSLHDPFLMSDMQTAVDRIASAREGGERIRVHGDYDVDGITGTAILVRTIARAGCTVDEYIPHRLEEGYGLRSEAVVDAQQAGVSLLITTDCGVRDVEEIELARKLGVDVIVADHHVPGPALPPANAVLCPKREGDTYPYQFLSGAGIAFKLGQAIVERLQVRTTRYIDAFLDLVALGTVADVVPLTGENRVLVWHGLARLPQTRKPGLAALMKNAGLAGPLSVRDVTFRLAPRLNAAGRMEHARLSLQLLMTEDPASAASLADSLEQTNRRRQAEQDRVWEEVLVQYEALDEKPRVTVLRAEDWHEGVIGVVASKLVDRTTRPAILFNLRGDTARGSGRSVEGFNVVEALDACADLITVHGGHALAAGLVLPTANLEPLSQRLNEIAADLPPEVFEPSIQVDAHIPLDEVSLGFVEELQRAAPFGEGNPEPVFVSHRLFPQGVRRVGNSPAGHLLFSVTGPDVKFPRRCLAMGKAEWESLLAEGREIAIAFTPRLDVFQGEVGITLFVEDAKSGPFSRQPFE